MIFKNHERYPIKRRNKTNNEEYKNKNKDLLVAIQAIHLNRDGKMYIKTIRKKPICPCFSKK